MKVLHRWRDVGETERGPYAIVGDPRLGGERWRCDRCGCTVRSPWGKPKTRRIMLKIGVGTDCQEELVRQVLES